MSKIFTGIIAIFTGVLITLRITGCIDWAWRWVFAPVWVPFAVAALVLTASMAVAVIKGMLEAVK